MNIVKFAICSFSLIYANTLYAAAIGGVSLGSTRVIYPANSKQVSLPLLNHSKKDRYLVNAWVDDINEEKTKDFLITPPIFVSEPDTENTFRIIRVTSDFPKNKESVYYINVKTIPSVSREVLEGSNVLQLAVLSRIKLFVRPPNLPYASEEAFNHIKFYKTVNGVEVDNKSPYFISFVNLKLDNKSIPSKMVAPLERTQLTEKTGTTFSYQAVNDYGGLTEIKEMTISNE